MRQHFATYHNHKEYMAYIVLTFYLAGVSALVASDKIKWETIASHCLMLYVTTAFSFAVAFFVAWQLIMRMRSATIIAVCDKVRLQWLPQEFPPLNLTPDWYKDIRLPTFLRDEIDRLPMSLSPLWRLGIPISFIVLWHALFLHHLAAAYPPPRPYDFPCLVRCAPCFPTETYYHTP